MHHVETAIVPRLIAERRVEEALVELEGNSR